MAAQGSAEVRVRGSLLVLALWLGGWLSLNQSMSPTFYVMTSETEACLPRLSESALSGLKMALRECRRLFRSQRWDCSNLQGIQSNQFHWRVSSLGWKKAKEPMLHRGFRETAFLQALLTAGVTHALARECLTTGQACGFPCSQRNPDPEGPLSSALEVSRLLWEDMDSRPDLPTLVQQHNRRVGRKSVWLHRKRQCKCHGISGSCELKTCWEAPTSNFRRLGRHLRRRYRSATLIKLPNQLVQRLKLRKSRIKQVTRLHRNNMSSENVSESIHDELNRSGNEITLPRDPYYNSANTIKRIARNEKEITNRIRRSLSREQLEDELLYYETSPNYCSSSTYLGWLGTRGRSCNASSQGLEGCESLCCGRGYDTMKSTSGVLRRRPCGCTFQWCCAVRCDTCLVERDEINVCK